jgi:hypothetical protein
VQRFVDAFGRYRRRRLTAEEAGELRGMLGLHFRRLCDHGTRGGCHRAPSARRPAHRQARDAERERIVRIEGASAAYLLKIAAREQHTTVSVCSTARRDRTRADSRRHGRRARKAQSRGPLPRSHPRRSALEPVASSLFRAGPQGYPPLGSPLNGAQSGKCRPRRSHALLCCVTLLDNSTLRGPSFWQERGPGVRAAACAHPGVAAPSYSRESSQRRCAARGQVLGQGAPPRTRNLPAPGIAGPTTSKSPCDRSFASSPDRLLEERFHASRASNDCVHC